MYLNKAIIVGNLTKDPELRAMPGGANVASFSIATNSVWRDRDGNKKEDVQFHNVVVFGNQATSCAEYLKKGQSVLVEGRIQTRSWDDKVSGEKRYRTEVVADRVQFGPKAGHGRPDSAPGASEEPAIDSNTREPVAETSAAPKKRKVGTTGIDYPEEDINPEDIPF